MRWQGHRFRIYARTSTAVVVLALVGAFALPPGRIGEAHGERMVMAEMTNIDAEHEPEA